MAFSMHSHSGQFCPGHAKDMLEEVILRAISLKFHLLALTEHMPRSKDEDLYPEEIAANETIAALAVRHAAYLDEALRLRSKYASSIKLLIGFEGDWIPRPAPSPLSASQPPTAAAKAAADAEAASLIQHYALLPATDFFVGSVHHVHGIPIDYDRATWEHARSVCGTGGGGDAEEALFCGYFDAQWDMLCAVRPRVVGHFDLIRLFSDEPDGSVRRWEREGGGSTGVWDRVRRNLKGIVEMGGLLEVNSSALRKGMKEPYPGREICLEFLALGGKLTLSDDSHGTAQVGLNYGRVSEYLKNLGVTELYYLERERETPEGAGKSALVVKGMTFEGFESGAFPAS